ncbi:MAG: Ycf66 family protein [Cyanobacteria bacterium P01_A01_bin.114]
MVNVGFSFASLLGIVFAIGGAGLYFLRQFRPNLARDYDVFFAAVGLSTGIILFFFGWQLEPVHQINTLLLTCTVFFFAYESIRLRGIAVEQAKRRTPVVDDDRPVSRVYRAELDDWEQLNDRARRQRIPSSRDSYDDDYDRYPTRPPYEDYRQPAGRLKPSEPGRRPRPPEDRRFDEGPARRPPSEDWGDEPPPRRRPPEGGDRRPRTGDGPPPRRRDRSDRTLNVRPYSERPDAGNRPESPGEGGYVNYRPVDKPPVDEP